MFWGKDKGEEIGPEALRPMLDSLFERKLGQLPANAERIVGGIRQAHENFGKACDEFEAVDAEPYVQNVYFQNHSSIKSQKAPYAKTLRKTIGAVDFESRRSPNAYEHYKELLNDLEQMRGEVLKVNGSFKIVVYCYPNQMGGMRRTFSELEKGIDSLKRELQSRSREAEEFNAVNERIARLSSQIEERDGIVENVRLLKESLSPERRASFEKQETELAERMQEKKAELEKLDSEIGSLSDRISLLTAGLDKPARKMDHSSFRKKQLHPYLTDPINEIRDRDAYVDFVAMVKELKDGIAKDLVETKNKESTLAAVSLLLDSDLYAMVDRVKALRQARLQVSYELKDMERTSDDIRKGRGASEKVAGDITGMEKRREDVEREILSVKKSIEQLFHEYYRKSIVIKA